MKFKVGEIAVQINCPYHAQFVCITGIGHGTKDLPSYYHKHYSLLNSSMDFAHGTVRESFLRKPTEEELFELRLRVAL